MTKVANLDIPLGVEDEDIVKFEVTMDDAAVMLKVY